MDSNRKIKEGEWLHADEGFAIADKIFDFYFEEYEIIPQDKKVGDYMYTMVQYKLFCDHDGQPRRRNRVKACYQEYCDMLNKRDEALVKRSIRDNPKEYASFVKLLNTKKEVRSWVLLAYETSLFIK